MSEKMKKLCELCEEQPATVLCAECCKCYCDECNEYMHKKESKKGHKPGPILESVVVNAMCPLHKNEPLSMFCVDDVKLCCHACTGRIEDLHKGHNVVDLTEVSQDNETFSAAEVRKRFVDALKCDDELDKKIEETIESIKKEGNEAAEKVKQTFIEAHEKLTEEEKKIMKELERVCNESEEVLQKNLGTLREVREYSKTLNEVNDEIQGKEISRMMELILVSSMEEQRRTMEELHRMMMTGLKVGWDSEKRKLTFTRTLFNGAPIPGNISFSSVLTREMKISWDCDLSRMSEEDQRKVKYVVEMKKGVEEEREWREVYSGAENKCNASGLERSTEYNVRVKCVIGEFHGGWGDTASVRTKEQTNIDSLILSQERDKETFKEKLSEWCGTSEFELLYRGTRDGFGASDFHRRCDNRGKTVVLVKNTSGHIFGGFASIPWASPSSSSHTRAPGSFIFTLTNMHGIQPTKFPLKDENDGNTVYHNNTYGPAFGGGHDLYISSACNSNVSSYSNFPHTFNDTTGKGWSIFTGNTSNMNIFGNNNQFQVREIEVFRVDI